MKRLFAGAVIPKRVTQRRKRGETLTVGNRLRASAPPARCGRSTRNIVNLATVFRFKVNRCGQNSSLHADDDPTMLVNIERDFCLSQRT